jgi:hypothetical protein
LVNQDNAGNVELTSGDLQWNNVSIKYGAGTDTYQSLAHVWNEWYRQYLFPGASHSENDGNEINPSQLPYILVRMEDLVFHTIPTIASICECAGGRIRTDQDFQFIERSAKADSPGHDTRTGFVEAYIKYSQPLQPGAGFTNADFLAAKLALDPKLLRLLQYSEPIPPQP